jgi:glucose-6-phosphate 1-dehydrogenase
MAAPATDRPVAKLADPCVLAIFGGAGDLTRRLLIPALCNLVEAGLLPESFSAIGIARTAMDSTAYRQRLDDGIREFAAASIAPAAREWLVERCHYLQGSFDDPATYEQLRSSLGELAATSGTRNAIFYLATPPDDFAPIVRRLGKAGLVEEGEGQWRRVVIEKPFGRDLASARALNRKIGRTLREAQIYRIDHYLGKETVQNILGFRFGNGIFEPLWSRQHIDHVQITVAETVGVETRGNFYDATGALRDMVPNHIFQLLALTAMEAPNSFAADAVRGEKSKVLDAVHRFDDDAMRNVVRGQYVAGTVNGKAASDYRREAKVAADSETETYVAMRLKIDNWRWAGVPFYLRTGKAMTRRKTEIAIRFKQAPLALFRDTPVHKLTPNWLVMHIQPEEGVSLQFGAKIPGPIVQLGSVKMDFRYADYFAAKPSTGYETLIYDCMIGDATLFQSADNIEMGWRVVQPILDAWRGERADGVAPYAAGSVGPTEADALIERDGRDWRPIDGAGDEKPS